MDAKFTLRYAHLASLLANGTIQCRQDEYIGRAADGVEVLFGLIGEERAIDDYLKTHYLPSDW